VADRGEAGSNFRFEVTIRADGDPTETETCWYRWDKDEKRWEFYGNEMPSWDDLSESNRDTLARVYDLIFRSHYRKERS
jgi:hypothetical protein